jgi:hypothetical protein
VYLVLIVLMRTVLRSSFAQLMVNPGGLLVSMGLRGMTIKWPSCRSFVMSVLSVLVPRWWG